MPEPLPPSRRQTDEPRPKRPRSGCLWLLMVAVVAGSVAAWWVRDYALRISATSNVYDVVARQRVAWNEGRLEDFMAEYWRSDDLTFFSGGTVTKGWQATLDRYRKRYQADGKEMGELAFDDITVDVTATDTAFVRGRWKVVTSKDTFEGLFTLLFRKIDGKWVIVHDHTSAADPPYEKAKPVGHGSAANPVTDPACLRDTMPGRPDLLPRRPRFVGCLPGRRRDDKPIHPAHFSFPAGPSR